MAHGIGGVPRRRPPAIVVARLLDVECLLDRRDRSLPGRRPEPQVGSRLLAGLDPAGDQDLQRLRLLAASMTSLPADALTLSNSLRRLCFCA
jgi:hypothetical protein